jgi:hypothetical protein
LRKTRGGRDGVLRADGSIHVSWSLAASAGFERRASEDAGGADSASIIYCAPCYGATATVSVQADRVPVRVSRLLAHLTAAAAGFHRPDGQDPFYWAISTGVRNMSPYGA